MADAARRTGPALEAHFQFLQWLVPTVERFPRRQKFLLGDRIQSVALDVLDALIEATYSREHRRGHLARANLGIEKLRFFFRLATDLQHLDTRRYEHAARSLDDIGQIQAHTRRRRHGRDRRRAVAGAPGRWGSSMIAMGQSAP